MHGTWIQVALSIAVAGFATGRATDAHAGEQALRNGRAAFSLVLDVSYVHVIEPERTGGAAHLGAGGIHARMIIGERLGLCAGFDTAVGGSDGGALYNLDLYLLGGGVRLGRAGFATVCAGAGIDGLYDAIPFAVQFPVEARLELDVGRARVAAFGRASWITADAARQSGAPTLPAGDELTAGLTLRLGKRVRRGDVRAGNGYLIGVVYRETLGARFIGATLGYGVSGGR